MDIALSLEMQIVEALKQSGFEQVFNHVPEEVKYPFIHIEEISCKPWLINPKAYIIRVKICIYVIDNSNKQILKLGEQLINSIADIGAKFELEESLSHLLKNNLWCNEIYLKIWQIEGEE